MANGEPNGSIDYRLRTAYERAVAIWKIRYPNGPTPTIVSGYRSRAEQDALRRAGATTVPGGGSRHNAYPARAIDVGFRRNGVPDRADDNFVRFAEIMQEVDSGIQWGGTFRKRDRVHWQIPGVTISGSPIPTTQPKTTNRPSSNKRSTPITGVPIKTTSTKQLSMGTKKVIIYAVGILLILVALKKMKG